MEARRGEIYRIPRQEMGRLKFVAALIKVGSHLFPVEQGYLVMEKSRYRNAERKLPGAFSQSFFKRDSA
jgi:hypothetical protein